MLLFDPAWTTGESFQAICNEVFPQLCQPLCYGQTGGGGGGGGAFESVALYFISGEVASNGGWGASFSLVNARKLAI